MDPTTLTPIVTHSFDFNEFLRVLFGTLISGTLLALGFLARDYFRFKVQYMREALTREKWEELCKQYRNTCDARICRKLDSVTKSIESSSSTLSDLAKQLTVVQTKLEPQVDKIKEIDILKEKIVRLESDIDKYETEIKNINELKLKIVSLESELKKSNKG